MTVSSQNYLTKKNTIQAELIRLGLVPGIEYAGCEMGWAMDIKRAGSVCPTSGIKRMRYGHWKERPLLWEVLASMTSWTS